MYCYHRGHFVSTLGRTIPKSIKLDKEVYNYINEQPGRSFNDKLHNLVYSLIDSKKNNCAADDEPLPVGIK